MNIKKYIAALILFLAFGLFQSEASASKLPIDVWNFIKASLPDAKQRFDSVVTLKNDIMYIPLYPPSDKTVDSIQIEYTYPNNKPLSSLPEVVLLNNGYSLLKVFKDASGNYTLTRQDELPIKVRLGLMPQDMLTPVGLKMPESLKLTLGDLLIPSKDESTLSLTQEEKEKVKSPFNPVVKRNEFVSIEELKNKKIYINPKNSKFLEAYNYTSKSPLYELKLASAPLKIIPSTKNDVALVLYWSEKKLDIIDLKNENIVTTISIDDKPTDACYKEKENLVYVTSQNAKAIYAISLDSMAIKKVIKLEQRPSKIAYSDIDNIITFYDDFQSKVFNVIESGNEYVVQPLGAVPNASKITSDQANVYVLSRTQNQIYVFDKVLSKLTKTIDTDLKPTDAILYNTRLYIICSKTGSINVYDTVLEKILSKENIGDNVFYSKMNLLPNEKQILITGSNSGNYILYSLDKMEIIKKQESYVDVSDIIILDKEQRL